MFSKIVRTAVTSLALLAGMSTLASAKAPWEGGQPKGMTQENAVMARDAQKYIDRHGRSAFGAMPQDVVWTDRSQKNTKRPVSNITAAELRKLMTGRYNIVINGPKKIEVRYLDADGIFHSCNIVEHKLKESQFRPVFNKSVAGPGGLFKPSPSGDDVGKDYGWPAIYSPTDGALDLWKWGRGKWHRTRTLVQDEIPAYAARRCKNLPNTGKVNEAQYRLKAVEWMKGSNSIKGAPVIFAHSALNPLTAGMLYWAYPPNR